MVQSQQYLGKQAAERLLELYFFDEGPYRVEIVPKRVDPQQADEFIRARVAPDSAPAVCRHARRFVDFYDLRRTLDHFRGFLDAAPRDGEAFSRGAQVVMLLAETGADEDWQRANDYFARRLLSAPPARQQPALLLQCWAALGPRAAGEKVEKALAAELALREKTRSRGDDAELAYQELRSLYVNQLPRVKRALEYRRRVEQTKGEARLKALIDNYARLDEYPPEYLNDWAARLLRRAAADDRQKGHLVTLMRKRILAAEQDRRLDGQTKLFVKRRLLRAIQYFDEAQLDAEQREFLEQQLKLSAEGDPLSTIQPQPLPG